MRLRKIQERYGEVLIYVVVVSKVDLSPVGSQLGKNVCHIRLSRTGQTVLSLRLDGRAEIRRLNAKMRNANVLRRLLLLLLLGEQTGQSGIIPQRSKRILMRVRQLSVGRWGLYARSMNAR